MEMAKLAQEIQRESEQYAKRPKRKYISANTKEYEFAAYMRAWVARIERIGNLNYPDEARRQQMHGQLVLTVGLTRDGRIKSIDVIQSPADTKCSTTPRSASFTSPSRFRRCRGGQGKDRRALHQPHVAVPARRRAADPLNAARTRREPRREARHAAQPSIQSTMPTSSSLTNQLLIAMPTLRDPNFARGVTFLCQHGEDGAMGLMINRLSEYRLGDVLAQMNMSSELPDVIDAPVLIGGPMQTRARFRLAFAARRMGILVPHLGSAQRDDLARHPGRDGGRRRSARTRSSRSVIRAGALASSNRNSATTPG